MTITMRVKQIHTHSLSLSHTQTHTNTLSRALTHTRTRTLFISLSLFHTHTNKYREKHTQTLSISSLSLFLFYTHTHTTKMPPADIGDNDNTSFADAFSIAKNDLNKFWIYIVLKFLIILSHIKNDAYGCYFYVNINWTCALWTQLSTYFCFSGPEFFFCNKWSVNNHRYMGYRLR